MFENYCVRWWEMVGVGKRVGRRFSDYLAIAEVLLREAAEAAGEAELTAYYKRSDVVLRSHCGSKKGCVASFARCEDGDGQHARQVEWPRS